MAPFNQRSSVRLKTKNISSTFASTSDIPKKKKNHKKIGQVETTREQDRIRSQKYRQGIKADGKKYEESCAKRQKRYQCSKEGGLIQHADELSNRALQKRRKNERERKRAYREKVRLKKNQEIENEENTGPLQVTSKQAKSGKKRKEKNRRKCYNMNAELRGNNHALKNSLRALKKRFDRLTDKISKKNEQNSNSPKSKVKRFLKGRKVPADVEERLVCNQSLVDQIKSDYDSSHKHAFKESIKSILCGKIIEKNRKKTALGKQLNIELGNPFGKSGSNIRLLKGQIMKKAVKDFLEDHSVTDPGKKSFITKNKIKHQKRYLDASLVDLHKQFSTETGLSISYKTFCTYRPIYIVNPIVTARDTCTCIVHENFKLLIKALHLEKIIQENSLHKIIENTLCQSERCKDCFFRNCLKCKDNLLKLDFDQNVQIIHYKKWVKITEKTISSKTKKEITITKTVKSDFNVNVKELPSLISSELNEVLQHHYRACYQQKILKDKRENLNDDEGFLLMDFSENYQCKWNIEVQAVHFGASRQQISLHTGIFYTKDFKEGFSVCSECLDHDATAIIAHIIKMLKHYLATFPHITKLHFMSDSPATQYRNKTVFFLLTQYVTRIFLQIKEITYNYTEKYHGKGPADGIGAVMKRTADQVVAYGQDVMNFNMFISSLQKHLSHVLLLQANSQDIKEIQQFVPAELQLFKGTMSVHQFTWVREKESDVFFNTLSCYICKPGVPCLHFYINKLIYESDDANIKSKSKSISVKKSTEPKVKAIMVKKNPVKNKSIIKKKSAPIKSIVIEKAEPTTLIVNKNAVLIKSIETIDRPIRLRRMPKKLQEYDTVHF